MSESDSGESPLVSESESEGQKNRMSLIWESVSQTGLSEKVLRLGTHALLVMLILIVAWGMREFYTRAQILNLPEDSAFAAPLSSPTPTAGVSSLAPLQPEQFSESPITRRARLHTDVPSRPRYEVLMYTVKEGDTLIGIAEKFGLQPETILWGNQLILGDNPHNLFAGQELNILSVDGAYHKWSAMVGRRRVKRGCQVL